MDQRAAAVWTVRHLVLGKDGFRFGPQFSEQEPNLEPLLARGAAEEAVVPDPGEPFGENVQEPAPDEFVRSQVQGADFARFAGDPA